MSTWRVGRKLGRTLYKDDAIVGLVDTPELAAEIVARMNDSGISRVGKTMTIVLGDLSKLCVQCRKPLTAHVWRDPTRCVECYLSLKSGSVHVCVEGDVRSGDVMPGGEAMRRANRGDIVERTQTEDCPAVGGGGQHSQEWYDGECCQFCGATPSPQNG